MPTFGTACKSYDPEHPVRKRNAEYSKVYYAKYGHTSEYKDRKKRERQRRNEYKKYLKLMQSSETTTRAP